MNNPEIQSESIESDKADRLDEPTAIEEVKVEINTLLWMWLPDRITLGEAEKISLKILELMLEAKDKGA